MQMRTILISAFALVFALCAALGAFLLVGTPAPNPDSVGVVVLRDNVLRGTTITAEVIEVHQMSKDAVPPGSIAQAADAVGRIVFIPMVKGDPLLETKLAPKGTQSGIDSQIEKGFRAYTIQVGNASAGVGGFILPGSFVDVMMMSNEAGPSSTAKTLLQMVKVLAVDQLIDAPKENVIKEMRSVTLQVEPQDAEQLAWAQARGTLSLSLRNVDDKQRLTQRDDLVEVVVAKENLSRGKTLTADSLELLKRPKPLVPADAYFDPADAVGRVTTDAVFKGELLLQSKLAAVAAVAVNQPGTVGGQPVGPDGQPAPPPLPVIQIIRGQNRAIVTLYPRANVGLAPK